jgi:hypothetical protein
LAKEDGSVTRWLLEKDQPAVRYNALVHLLDLPQGDEEVREARSEIASRGWAKDIFDAQKPGGFWESREDLYRPKYLATNWRAIVLADLGLTAEDPRIEATCSLFFSEWMPKGKFEEGEVCIVGNFARTLARFGYADDPRVERLYECLVETQKEDGGWHCFPSKKGTLDCWEALAAYAVLPRNKRSRKIMRSIERGAEFYLERKLFRQGRRYEPWFRFHYPVHYYYDILVGLDVITALGYGADRRLGPALRVMEERRRTDGRWNLDSIHSDLGPGAGYSQKKKPTPFALEKKAEPSKWITLTALRVLKRVGEARSE